VINKFKYPVCDQYIQKYFLVLTQQNYTMYVRVGS
jgi:hypothetical protein